MERTPDGFSVRARSRSFVYAVRGLRALIVTQHNAWIHAVATCSVVVLGLSLGVSRLEWLSLVLAVVIVWSAEAMNTALEFLCDVASPDFNPLVGRAKDVAAGAVFIAALGATVVGALVFGPYVLRLSQ